MNKPILLQFLDFLKKPSFLQFAKEEKLNQKSEVFKVLGFGLACALVIQVLLYFFASVCGLNIEDKNQVYTTLNKIAPIQALIFAVFIGPLMEEFAFRMGLVKNRLWSLLGFSFGFYYLLSGLIGVIFSWFVGSEVSSGWGNFLFFLLLILLAGSYFFYEKLDTKKFNHFLEKYFVKIFYTLSLGFALMHLANFSNLLGFWYLIPFLVLPQFWAGLMFGFLRQKYNFVVAVLGHMLHNFLIFFPLFLVVTGFNESNYPKFTELGHKIFSLGGLNFWQLVYLNLGFMLIIFSLGLILTVTVLALWESWRYLKTKIPEMTAEEAGEKTKASSKEILETVSKLDQEEI